MLPLLLFYNHLLETCSNHMDPEREELTNLEILQHS